MSNTSHKTQVNKTHVEQQVAYEMERTLYNAELMALTAMSSDAKRCGEKALASTRLTWMTKIGKGSYTIPKATCVKVVKTFQSPEWWKKHGSQHGRIVSKFMSYVSMRNESIGRATKYRNKPIILDRLRWNEIKRISEL